MVHDVGLPLDKPSSSRRLPPATVRRLRVTNSSRGHVRRTSVDPPIPDEIAAARKSAVSCHFQTIALHQARLTIWAKLEAFEVFFIRYGREVDHHVSGPQRCDGLGSLAPPNHSHFNCNDFQHSCRRCRGLPLLHYLRTDLKAARTSSEKSFGSSQAAKWPPRSTSLK